VQALQVSKRLGIPASSLLSTLRWLFCKVVHGRREDGEERPSTTSLDAPVLSCGRFDDSSRFVWVRRSLASVRLESDDWGFMHQLLMA
jgi:hypothetical protein